jgi:hypothetical protein
MFLAATSPPAAGAPIAQVVIASAAATLVTAGLLWLVLGHRSGRTRALERAAARAGRIARLPGWAALPSGIASVSLLVALLGLYWDIAFHIDDGRDPGPLANPAHYLILLGLYGIFTAGVLAVALPRGERPGPAAVRIARDWHAPVGGVLMAASASFALLGFPLDDVWHRLFGQDVTLWGPTHLMMLGGAALSQIGMGVLLAEALRAREREGRRRSVPAIVAARRASLMGGLLVGLSIFQGEFDFGVPQFRLVLHPFLLAVAAGAALVAARLWVGRGGALGAAVFFVVTRGVVALIVGVVFGRTTPHMPLYVVEALCVEAAALALLGRRGPLAFGLVAGLGCGTIGFAAEYGWSQFAFPLPWTPDILPEGLLLAAGGGAAAGVLGALLSCGLCGELPRVGLTRAAAALATLVLGASAAEGLVTSRPGPLRGAATVIRPSGGADGQARVEVRIDPPARAHDAAWLTLTAWQGGGLVVDRLVPAADGGWRTTRAVPLHGDWKASVRLQHGRELLALPVYAPADPAIPARAVAAPPRFERAFVADQKWLQREQKRDVPGWLWATAAAVVLACYATFFAGLAVGVGRFARREAITAPVRPAGRPVPA